MGTAFENYDDIESGNKVKDEVAERDYTIATLTRRLELAEELAGAVAEEYPCCGCRQQLNSCDDCKAAVKTRRALRAFRESGGEE
jgi:hypothetical protein